MRDTTAELLERVRHGDEWALDELCRRHVPRLRRWAAGRLPRWARDAIDTDDLVQDALLNSVQRAKHFEPHHDGAFFAYLRQAVRNRIRDEIRRVRRRPAREGLDSDQAGSALSPLESAVGRELVERYERALERLRPEQREAIVLRIELGFEYDQLAEALKRPSPDAARMAVSRALLRLAHEMNKDG